MSLQPSPTPTVVVHGWRAALLLNLVLVMDVPFQGGKITPVLEGERLHNTFELLFTDSLPPVSPSPVEETLPAELQLSTLVCLLV